jgi:RimJ/RimL family protein N-acetyltransferase
VDVRLTLEGPTSASVQPVRPHRESDIETLRRIARVSHTDTRFYADPRFPDERCDELYDTWIRRSCEGWADVVLVAEREDAPVGYMTVHRRNGVGSLGLLGVDPAARGHGIGESLVRGALAWCADAGIPRGTLFTQARNVGSQRLFQRLGFRTAGVDLWLHKWFT